MKAEAVGGSLEHHGALHQITRHERGYLLEVDGEVALIDIPCSSTERPLA